MALAGTDYIPDIDEFVAALGKDGCQNGLDHNMQTRQFCGFHPDCKLICSDAALQRAMGILKSEYFLVGVLEDLNLTVKLLEQLAPSFFGGLASTFQQANTVRHRVGERNVTLGSTATRSKLREYNQQDDKLYRYARQLLRRRACTCASVCI